jgi:hypothetical protein
MKMENTTEQEYIKELCEGNKKAFEVLFLRVPAKTYIFSYWIYQR